MSQRTWVALAATVVLSAPLLNCAESSGPETSSTRQTVSTSYVPRADAVEFALLRERALALRASVKENGAKPLTAVLRHEADRLAADYNAFATRTGRTYLTVRKGVRLTPVGGPIGNIQRGPTAPVCWLCPRVPPNEPVGYVCILIDTHCDANGNRICTYQCYPVDF